MAQFTVLCLFLIAGYTSAIFPPQFQRCDRRMGPAINQCLSRSIFNAIRTLSYIPAPLFGFPRLEPLYVGHFSFNLERIGDAKYTDYQVHGYSRIQQLPQVHLDQATNTLHVRLVFPNLIYSFDFVYEGIIGGEQVNATGSGRITSEHERYDITIQLAQDVGQDGQRHLCIRDVDTQLNRPEDVKRYDFSRSYGSHTPQQLTNLFNTHKDEFLASTNKEYGLKWSSMIKQWMDDLLPRVTLEEFW